MKRPHGAFILTRYSTDHQNEDTTEVQIEKCTEWCQRNGLPVLGVFSDLATSGMKDTRKEYSRMLQQLRQGLADTVIIYDQSRMFRKMTAWFAFREELEQLGVTVISATQPMIGKDLRDPANFLHEGSTALFNQLWVLQTRQKVIEKMCFMARNGQHTGGKPALGYAVEGNQLVVCEEEATIVRRIFAEYAQGRSYREIIAGLNADGLTTKSGRPFGSNSLHDLMRNEKYIGVIVYGKAPRRANGKRNNHGAEPDNIIRIEDAIPAIVDRDIWEKVQRKMDANKKAQAGRPATVREYPLKGKVFCGECGAAMVHSASTTQSGRYHYYTCSGRQRLHNCDLKAMKAGDLEKVVAQTVRNTLGKPGKIDALLQILREEREMLVGRAVDRLRAMIARKSEIEEHLDKATNAVLMGLNSSTLVKKIQSLELEKTKLEKDMLQLKRAMDAAAIPEERLLKLLDVIVGEDAAILSIITRVEISHTTISIWTLFDTDDDGGPDKTKFREEDLMCIEGEGSDALGDAFINIPGASPPAPAF